MFKALIFDFDGLIVDTETPEVQAWQKIYSEYKQPFPQDEWGKIIGGYGISNFDAAEHLRDQIGDVVELDDLRARQRSESDALTLRQPILPGVLDIIHNAKHRGIKLAIASSSPHSWVDTHLSRLGLARHFDKVICADDVAPGGTKPNPDLFLKALHELCVNANEAIVFEDSPNGVKAAKSAGIFVVAVPNPITSLLKIDGADLTLKSLADFNLHNFLL
ncbi:MAG: HAD family phosphatase [Chloroflexi bacterium]|nr:HAD family phosphatase [Chloroflexota bacterium]